MNPEACVETIKQMSSDELANAHAELSTARGPVRIEFSWLPTQSSGSKSPEARGVLRRGRRPLLGTKRPGNVAYLGMRAYLSMTLGV
jgi:hypothetical protein